MGDNRDNSADSRFMDGVGFVPVENLVGRAEILFFSIDAEYPWWEFWQWPFEIRWSRLLKPSTDRCIGEQAASKRSLATPSTAPNCCAKR